MGYLLMHSKRCPLCNQGVESSSGSETMHDDCYREHRQQGVCTTHDYCKRAVKEGW